MKTMPTLQDPCVVRIPTAGVLRSVSETAVVGLALTALLIYPLASFLSLAFWPSLFGQHASTVPTPLHDLLSPYNLRALTDSCWVGATAALVATVLGIWLSWLTSWVHITGRRVVEGGIWWLLIMPSYVMAVSWQTLLVPGGLLGSGGGILGLLRLAVLGPGGVVMVLALKGVPLAYIAMSSSWRGIGAATFEVARVHGMPARVRTILLARLLLPAIASAWTLVFAESVSDFGVAVTLGANAHLPLVTYAIYAAINSVPLNFSLAAANSLLLFAAVLIAVWVQGRVAARAARYAVLTGRTRPVVSRRISGHGTIIQGLGLTAFFAVALLLPVLAALATSLVSDVGLHTAHLTLAHYRAVLSQWDAVRAFSFSGEQALIGASFAVLLGLLTVFVLVRRGPAGRVFDLVLLAALALPGLILGCGYLLAYNRPDLPLYGTPALLTMAYVALQWPVASRILLGPAAQLHRNLGEAAQVHGVSKHRLWAQIYLPLLAVPIVFAWIASASRIMFELPASEILYPPGSQPLAVALVNDVTGFRYGLEVALALVAIVAVALIGLLARALFARAAPQSWKWGDLT